MKNAVRILDSVTNAVLTEFCSRFAPRGRVLWVNEVGEEPAYKRSDAFHYLKLPSPPWHDLPNIVISDEKRNWLFLIDIPRIRSQMNGERCAVLEKIFRGHGLGLVFLNAFKNRRELGDLLLGDLFLDLPWQTAAWIAEEPDHMIYFNGGRLFEPKTDHPVR